MTTPAPQIPLLSNWYFRPKNILTGVKMFSHWTFVAGEGKFTKIYMVSEDLLSKQFLQKRKWVLLGEICTVYLENHVIR